MEEARRRPAKLKGPGGPGSWSYALELCPLQLPRKAGDWTPAWEREGCAGCGVEKAVPETSPTGTQGHWSPLSDVPSYSRQAGGCAEEVTSETAQARGLCPPLGLGPHRPWGAELLGWCQVPQDAVLHFQGPERGQLLKLGPWAPP